MAHLDVSASTLTILVQTRPAGHDRKFAQVDSKMSQPPIRKLTARLTYWNTVNA